MSTDKTTSSTTTSTTTNTPTSFESVLEELDIKNRKYCIFPHYTYDEQSESTFCYSGDKQGVKNLKAILPIIEEMGCTYHWNGKGNSRISITWE